MSAAAAPRAESHTPDGWLKLAELWQSKADLCADPKFADIYFSRADEAFAKALLAESEQRANQPASAGSASSKEG